MGLIAQDTGGQEFELIEPGTYTARCIGVVDLGTKDNTWQGVTRKRHQIFIQWELPLELFEDGELKGQPRSIGKFYTLSLSEKSNLRPDLEGWRGKAFTEDECKGFDISNLLGAPCLLSVIDYKKNNGSMGVKVNSISKLGKGMDCPGQINPSKYFSFADKDNMQQFEKLTEGLQRMIKESDEWRILNELGVSAKEDEGRPFEDEYPMPEEEEIPF